MRTACKIALLAGALVLAGGCSVYRQVRALDFASELDEQSIREKDRFFVVRTLALAEATPEHVEVARLIGQATDPALGRPIDFCLSIIDRQGRRGEVPR